MYYSGLSLKYKTTPKRMKTATVIARIDLDTKRKLQDLVRQLGVSESTLIRELVQKEVNAVISVQSDLKVIPNGERRVKITIRLPHFIGELAKARAADKGMPLSRWIGNLIQSHVYLPPVVTREELKVLVESNRQLRSIGTNINQIARAFNRNELDIRWLSAMGELEARITENRGVISQLIQAVNRSWRVKDGAH